MLVTPSLARRGARAGALALSLTAVAGVAGAQVTAGKLTVSSNNGAATENTPAFRSVAQAVPQFGVTIPATDIAASNPSPYQASLNIGVAQNVAVFCVDMLNGITIPSGSFDINATNLGTATTLTATRFTDGTSTIPGYVSALDRYRMASVLAAKAPSLAGNQFDDLQIAIWAVMYGFGTNVNLVPATISAPVAAWVAQANTARQNGFAGYSFANAYVITDAAVAGVQATSLSRYRGTGRQEFVTAATVVPEPSTYALMGFGLVTLAGAVRRNRGLATRV